MECFSFQVFIIFYRNKEVNYIKTYVYYSKGSYLYMKSRRLKMNTDELLLTTKTNDFMFTSDRFFKYVFLCQNEDSFYLCNLLFKHLLGKEFQKIVSVNTHFLSKKNEKDMICDVLLDAGDSLRVNIEMQNEVSRKDSKRFDMYLSKMFIESMKDYDDAKNAMQILFFNKDHHKLVEYHTLKDEQCKTSSKSWLRIIIYLKYIKNIVKEKGIDGLNEFEKLIYIFVYSNVYDIIESEKRTGKRTRVVEIMDRKKDEFLRVIDEQWRLYSEYCKEKEREEYVKEQVEDAIRQGKERTILDNIINLSKNMNIAYIQAMEALNLSKEEQEHYLKLLDA